MKAQNVICFLGIGLMTLWLNACKTTNDPTPNQPVANRPPARFVVQAKTFRNSTEVSLSWMQAKDPDGDPVTYTVFYKDTLARNLTDTTFIIPKTDYNSTVAGVVIARDNRGAATSSTFRVTTGQPPNLPPDTFRVSARLAPNSPNVILTWDKAPDGDPITYAVFYKDTLVKNSADTTFTISNVGYNTTITGNVIAKDSKGATTSVTFSILTTPIVAGQRFRIKRTIINSYNSQSYAPTTYFYDKNGRLSTFYEAYGRNSLTISGRRTTNLTYDEQGHLLYAEGKDDGTGGYLSYRYEYGYDNQGKLISEKYYSTNSYDLHTLVFKSESRFEYDQFKHLTKKTVVSSIKQVVEEYTYSNDNLIRVDRSDAVGSSYDPISYRYDTNPNPFYGLTTASLLGDIALAYSKNNPIFTSNDTSITTSFRIYTYDSNGLLVKIASPDGGYIKTYEYEAY